MDDEGPEHDVTATVAWPMTSLEIIYPQNRQRALVWGPSRIWRSCEVTSRRRVRGGGGGGDGDGGGDEVKGGDGDGGEVKGGDGDGGGDEVR